jgi:hypothetical protein
MHRSPSLPSAAAVAAPDVTRELLTRGPPAGSGRAPEGCGTAEVMRYLTEDHDRIAQRMNDVVIRRIFTAGLDLQTALALIGDHSGASKIYHALDELDQAIRDIRDTIFDRSPPGSPRLSHQDARQAALCADPRESGTGEFPAATGQQSLMGGGRRVLLCIARGLDAGDRRARPVYLFQQENSRPCRTAPPAHREPPELGQPQAVNPLPVDPLPGRIDHRGQPASPAPPAPSPRPDPAGSGPGSGPARAWNRSARCRAPTGNPVIVSAYAEVRLRWLWHATPALLRRRCSGPRRRSVPTRTFAHREVALAQSAAGPADGCRLFAGFRSILSMGIPARDDEEVI